MRWCEWPAGQQVGEVRRFNRIMLLVEACMFLLALLAGGMGR